MTEECSSCRFYRSAKPRDPHGTCHRHPPAVSFEATSQGIHVTGGWAPIPPNEWCGEWKTKETLQ